MKIINKILLCSFMVFIYCYALTANAEDPGFKPVQLALTVHAKGWSVYSISGTPTIISNTKHCRGYDVKKYNKTGILGMCKPYEQKSGVHLSRFFTDAILSSTDTYGKIHRCDYKFVVTCSFASTEIYREHHNEFAYCSTDNITSNLQNDGWLGGYSVLYCEQHLSPDFARRIAGVPNTGLDAPFVTNKIDVAINSRLF